MPARHQGDEIAAGLLWNLEERLFLFKRLAEGLLVIFAHLSAVGMADLMRAMGERRRLRDVDIQVHAVLSGEGSRLPIHRQCVSQTPEIERRV